MSAFSVKALAAGSGRTQKHVWAWAIAGGTHVVAKCALVTEKIASRHIANANALWVKGTLARATAKQLREREKKN